MKRIVVLGGLLALSFVAPVLGAGPDCIPKNRCTNGLTPPLCCEPPPCEYYEEIRRSQAIQSVFSERGLALASSFYPKDRGKQMSFLRDWYDKEKEELAQVSRCNPDERLPQIHVNEKCDIVDPSKPEGGGRLVIDRTQFLRDNEGCPELLGARFDRAWSHREACRTGSRPTTLKALGEKNRQNSQETIDDLMGQLQGYWNACSSFVGDADRRELESLGVEMRGPGENPYFTSPELLEALRSIAP